MISVYAAFSPSLPEDFSPSIAGRDFIKGGDEGSEGGEVAKLSRSSKLARALQGHISELEYVGV